MVSIVKKEGRDVLGRLVVDELAVVVESEVLALTDVGMPAEVAARV
jgi:hypothetical protein